MNLFHPYNRRSRELLKASVFFMGMLMVFCFSIFVMFNASGPIVLGTEMNANGLVEYLCLGQGCEHLQDMDW